MVEEFSREALKAWNTYPKDVQTNIIQTVFCVRCLRGVEMVDYGGEIDSDGLVLHGKCKDCGHKVTRVVD